MEASTPIKTNWLTRKPDRDAFYPTVILVALLALGTFLFVMGIFNADQWMPASSSLIFEHREYWRAWTAIFAHAGGVHLLSNLILFVPFAYFLMGHFGYVLFPLSGLLVGGLVNLVVVNRMPAGVTLVGASGVVYWLGAVWITLSFLLDRRQSTSRRAMKAIGVSAVLFLPETFRPEVSYLAHFLGYVAGVLSGLIHYRMNRTRFLEAESMAYFYEWDPLEVVDVTPDTAVLDP